MNLFNYEPEKMWGFPATYSKDKKRKEFEDAIASGQYLGSEKRDGHWHRFVKQGEVAKIQSRGISTVTKEYGDQTEHVPHIFNFLKNMCLGDTMLIGEMYVPGKKDRDMTKIFGCLPKKAVERQQKEYGMVRFAIFDVLYFDGQDLTKTAFEDRVQFLNEIVAPYLSCNEYIDVVEYFESNEISDRLAEILARGGEGIVMTKKLSYPAEGARTARKTIKIKAELEEDIDVFLTGGSKPADRLYKGKEIETWTYWENLKSGLKMQGAYYDDYVTGATIEPITKNHYNQWPGSLEIAVFKEDGTMHSLGYVSGLNEEIKQKYTDCPDDHIQRVCKVSCMEFTPDKKLRHPKFKGFRNDINAEDCTYKKIFG